MADATSVLVIYRVKQGKEQEFRQLLGKHWSTLNGAGLVSSEPSRVLRGDGGEQKALFIELFSWKDAKSATAAQQKPEVTSLWTSMAALVDGMEVVNAEQVKL
jgi:quinol monooxygenase YgiN